MTMFLVFIMIANVCGFVPSHRRQRVLASFSTDLDLTISTDEPVKKKRGRPRKIPENTDSSLGDEPIKPVKKKAAPKTKKTTSLKAYKAVPTIDMDRLHDQSRELWKTSLIIVRAEGLPGDDDFFDVIKKTCIEMYEDSMTISESRRTVDDVDDYDPEFPDDPDEDSEENGQLDPGSDGVQSDEEYDPELIEIWVESKGKVLRLFTRRIKNPVELTSEVQQTILDGVAEYMDEEHQLTVECFRDATNMPELS
eukprot:CAMPEP_0171606494 /NCGR_PEP_ID=MMETSP0990-20121206/7797_1 /TAXON_ID=483369 /ORGANISM="non described non described, Strain CCMP2098" /LENGTH=251 /DNA_ID=CAMNT_0012169343 /DNA_START=88 /DNA_END=843 /DNA_ORIENTATION=-